MNHKTSLYPFTVLTVALLTAGCGSDSDDPVNRTAEPFETVYPHGAMLHLVGDSDALPTIGFNHSLTMQAGQSCFTYQQTLNQTLGNGNDFTMDTNETVSSVESTLGVTTSVGVKMKVFNLSEYNSFVKSQTSNQSGVSVVYNVGGYQGFTNQVSAVGENYLKLPAADFARTCGSSVLTNYVGSYKVYVSLSIQSNNTTFNQSITNTAKTKIKFVDLMNEVSKQQSSTSASVNIAASYYTIGLPQSAGASIAGVFADPSFSDCTQIKNVASSCATFSQNLTNAIAKIESGVQTDITNQKAFYLYYNPAASTSSYAPVGNLGISGLKDIADAFLSVEKTFSNNLDVALDLNTAADLAEVMADNTTIQALPPNALLAVQDAGKAYRSNGDNVYAALQGCANLGACSTTDVPFVTVAGLLAKAPVALQNLYLMALSPTMEKDDTVFGTLFTAVSPAIWFYRSADSGTGYDLDILTTPVIGFPWAENLEVANIPLDVSKLSGTLAATWTTPPQTTGGDLFTLHDQMPGCTLTSMTCTKKFSGTSVTLPESTWTVTVVPNPNLFLTVMQPTE